MKIQLDSDKLVEVDLDELLVGYDEYIHDRWNRTESRETFTQYLKEQLAVKHDTTK